jgi:LCP family protein required for cell wall assembly
MSKPETGPQTPWHKRKPSWKRLAVTTAVFGSLGAVALVGGKFYANQILPGEVAGGRHWRPGTTKPDPPGTLAFGDKDRMNILLLGIDYNYDDKGILYTKNARSDTMMVISINKNGDFLNMVSIPRDTQVLINDKVGFDKINDAYAVGGPQQAMRTVTRFLGTEIDHYVVIKVYGARKIFDALGGLKIDVEKDMDYDDNWGHLHVHLKKGFQRLNADQAVGYARFRHDAESDRGRMRRQQQVIQTLVAQLKNPTIVARLPALAKAISQTLETDINLPQIYDLAMLYKGFNRKNIHSAQIAGGDAMINGVSMLIPFQAENEKTVRLLLKDETDLSLHEIRLEVLNGTHTAGTARKTADDLGGTGFNVTRVADADNGNYGTTQIVEHVQNNRIHGRLASLFPGASFKFKKDKSNVCDYVITVGSDHTPLASTDDSHRPFNPDGTGPTGGSSEIARQPAAEPPPRARLTRSEPRQEVEPPVRAPEALSPPPLENPRPREEPAPRPATVPVPEVAPARPEAAAPSPVSPASAPVIEPIATPVPAGQ